MSDLLSRYKGNPLETSFRELVGVLPADESTHSLFPYPARLLRHIPRMLLSSQQVLDGMDYVIDPFCGSGTVLLEAQNRGIPSVGIDQNPVAALISRVKTTPLESSEMNDLLIGTLAGAKRIRGIKLPAEYLRKWYDAPALSALSRLSDVVQAVEDQRHRDFLSVVLASTARKLAHVDPRIPVPVRRMRSAGPSTSTAEAWTAWQITGQLMSTKIARIRETDNQAHVIHGDSRTKSAWRSPRLGRPSLIVTSPPYGAAQKYIRSTSLDSGWLGFAADKGTIGLERSSIGREHLTKNDRAATPAALANRELTALLERLSEEHPIRASIYTNYFLDMDAVLRQSAKDEVNCQRLVLICGTNMVRGQLIKTHDHLSEMAESYGFTRKVSLRDSIKGRTLMTTRKSGSTPAPAEYVDIFERN